MPASSSPRLPWVVAATLAVVFLASVARSSLEIEGVRYFALFDDGMISLRYARHLASGEGLVWNPGERVQGYTNLGWTLVMALVQLLPLPLRLVPLAVQLLNLPLLLGLAEAVRRAVRRWASAGLAAACALAVGLHPPTLFFAVQGWETTLQTLLITCALLPWTSDEPVAPRTAGRALLLTALAAVVRLDGVIWMAAAAWLTLLEPRPAASGGARARGVELLALLLGVALVAGVLAWQHSYYGDWLPNTFALKATGGASHARRGLGYLARFALEGGFAVLLAAGAELVAAARSQGAARRRALGWAGALSGWFGYVVVVGGDVHPFHRFVAPASPLLFVLAARYVQRRLAPALEPRPDGVALTLRTPGLTPLALGASVAAVALIEAAQLAPAQVPFHEIAPGGNRSAVLAALAITRAGLPSDATVGVFWAGTTPYYLPHLRMHDLLGKCDRHIAHRPAGAGVAGHSKWDYDYSLGQVRPAVLIPPARFTFASVDEARALVDARVLYSYHPALYAHPLFQRDYAPRPLPARVGGEAPELFTLHGRVDADLGAWGR